LNESLMELGATVCAPRGAACGRCPVAGLCKARAEGKQEEIPSPKSRARRKALHCVSVVVREGDEGGARVLVEQRGAEGLWREMWQAPTLESETPVDGAAFAREVLGDGSARLVGAFGHMTTHRDVRFEVWAGDARAETGRGRFVSVARARKLPMSSAQQRILFELGCSRSCASGTEAGA
jgi:adenine-specific DNA glycosylase